MPFGKKIIPSNQKSKIRSTESCEYQWPQSQDRKLVNRSRQVLPLCNSYRTFEMEFTASIYLSLQSTFKLMHMGPLNEASNHGHDQDVE